MNKHTPLAEVNSHQADMLDAMRDARASMSPAQIQQALGAGGAGLTKHLDDLRERALVDVTSEGRRVMYTISRKGRWALARYKRGLAEVTRVVVPPATFNTLGQPLKLDKRAYYRNDGNKHILARGVSC